MVRGILPQVEWNTELLYGLWERLIGPLPTNKPTGFEEPKP